MSSRYFFVKAIDYRSLVTNRSAAARSGSSSARMPSFAEVIDADHLRRIACEMKRDGDDKAPGPDGVRFCDLSTSELANICRQLHRALADGSWQPSTSRKVRIPKGGGKFRELSLQSVATRIVARAVHCSLAPYWESIFLDCSYGCRKGCGIDDMWLALERLIVQQGRWVIAQDDIRQAFDSVTSNRIMEDHRLHITDGQLLHVIEQLLVGHPSERRQAGILTGSSYSPDALNLHLHHAVDLPLTTGGFPGALRYVDNLVEPVTSVPEAQETTGRKRQLLERVGLQLKGEDPIVDLRQGEAASVLGLQIRAESEQLKYDLSQDAWQGLRELLEEARELDYPVAVAQAAVQGWIAAYGPAFVEARRQPVAERILAAAAEQGIAELPGDGVVAALQAAADRWTRLRATRLGGQKDRAC